MVKKEKLINVKVMTMTNELGSNFRDAEDIKH